MIIETRKTEDREKMIQVFYNKGYAER